MRGRSPKNSQLKRLQGNCRQTCKAQGRGRQCRSGWSRTACSAAEKKLIRNFFFFRMATAFVAGGFACFLAGLAGTALTAGLAGAATFFAGTAGVGDFAAAAAGASTFFAGAAGGTATAFLAGAADLSP